MASFFRRLLARGGPVSKKPMMTESSVEEITKNTKTLSVSDNPDDVPYETATFALS